jgi:hypothetical protein
MSSPMLIASPTMTKGLQAVGGLKAHSYLNYVILEGVIYYFGERVINTCKDY